MQEYSKSIAAFVVSAAGLVGTALLDGNLSTGEALAALGGALVTTAAVYGFKNTAA